MASFINASDVVTAAVEIERRGHDFYRRAQDCAGSPKVAEFFSFMAGEEEKHEKIFQTMLDRIGAVELPLDSSGQEYLDYLQASLDSHVLFTQEVPQDISDPFPLAVRFEKDTILYFLAMLDLVPESEQQYVHACIREEKRHILLLSEKHREFKNQSS